MKVGENLAAGEPATSVSPGRPLLAMPVWELVSPTSVLASGGGVAHRGRFLELDVDAAAFDGLLEIKLCLVGEIVVVEPVGTQGCLLSCQRALTQKQTLSGRQAHLSEVTALSLSPSHSLVMPSVV